jgi:hypothetical protein
MNLLNVLFANIGNKRSGKRTVRFHLPRNTTQFLGHYGELHHADVSLHLNKIAGSKFGPVQSYNGAWHPLL